MQKKGFTLIELLVVIAIIGILAAIGITAFGGAQGKARDSKRKSDMGGLMAQLVIYYDDNNTYPKSGANDNSPIRLDSQGAMTAIAPGWSTSIPSEPQTSGNATGYWYISTALGDRAAVFTRLEAKQVWFISNSSGWAGEVTANGPRTSSTPVPQPNNNATNATGSTSCKASTDGNARYEPCLASPTMDEA